jgi:hypothetical protein
MTGIVPGPKTIFNQTEDSRDEGKQKTVVWDLTFQELPKKFYPTD